MADGIEKYLGDILAARYGEEVRQSIHDAIRQCYEDGKAGATDLVAREQIALTDGRLSAQIANLVANNNPTEGNSELVDIRVGADGTTYESAGEAVREQFKQTKEDLNKQSTGLYYRYLVEPSSPFSDIIRPKFFHFFDYVLDGSGHPATSEIDGMATEYKKLEKFLIIKREPFSSDYDDFTLSVYKRKNAGSSIEALLHTVEDFPIVITDLDSEYAVSSANGGSEVTYETFYKNARTWTPGAVLNVFERKKYTFESSDISYFSFIKNETDGKIGLSNIKYSQVGALPVCFKVNNQAEGYIESSVNKDRLSCIFMKVDDLGNVFERKVIHPFEKYTFFPGYNYLIALYINIPDSDLKDYMPVSFVLAPSCPEELYIDFSQGSFNGGGGDYETTTKIRTQKIFMEPGFGYMATVPDDILIVANIEENGARVNVSDIKFGFFAFPKTCQDFIRFAFYKKEGDTIIAPEESEIENIKVYKVSLFDGKVVVGNSENIEKNVSIYCDGTNDQQILNILFRCRDSINIKLLKGSYYLKKLYKNPISGQIFAVSTTSNSPYKTICVEGEYPTRASDYSSVRFVVDIDPSEINEEEENSIFLVPRLAEEMDDINLSNTMINFKNICVLGCGYTKPITYLDFTHAQSCVLENIMVRADGSESGLSVFPTKPNIDCVGIRVGYGSNNGIQNEVKHCLAYFCGKGFSCCGEHYIFRDCLAHHCYVGFAFGDRLTRGNYEHPNILFGCSVEGCYRLMELGRYGQSDGDETTSHNTLICVGLSTETRWDIPTDEGGGTANTKPILEIRKGCYRGRIELDYFDYPFEKDGSGRKMKYIFYNGAGAHVGNGGLTE